MAGRFLKKNPDQLFVIPLLMSRIFGGRLQPNKALFIILKHRVPCLIYCPVVWVLIGLHCQQRQPSCFVCGPVSIDSALFFVNLEMKPSPARRECDGGKQLYLRAKCWHLLHHQCACYFPEIAANGSPQLHRLHRRETQWERRQGERAQRRFNWPSWGPPYESGDAVVINPYHFLAELDCPSLACFSPSWNVLCALICLCLKMSGNTVGEG